MSGASNSQGQSSTGLSGKRESKVEGLGCHRLDYLPVGIHPLLPLASDVDVPEGAEVGAAFAG